MSMLPPLRSAYPDSGNPPPMPPKKGNRRKVPVPPSEDDDDLHSYHASHHSYVPSPERVDDHMDEDPYGDDLYSVDPGAKRPPSAPPSEHFVDPPDVTISLKAGGDIVVAPTGTLESDIDNDGGYLLVEGKVIGNVSVRRVQISSSGHIFGDITCNSFIIAPGAVVIGACQVRPEPPEKNLG
ncbi:cysteine desulfurase [Aureococcus anophagefferens]|nr:cysteine desulfurase [Aureococcus anophagefferens]